MVLEPHSRGRMLSGLRRALYSPTNVDLNAKDLPVGSATEVIATSPRDGGIFTIAGQHAGMNRESCGNQL